MQIDAQLTNYLLWLGERGIDLPAFFDHELSAPSDECAPAVINSFGGEFPNILFLGDGGSALSPGESGPLPVQELQLIQNIGKALGLTPETFHYANFQSCLAAETVKSDEVNHVYRDQLIATIKKLNPSGVVILGGETLNLVSGKNLNFEALRGKVITPEMYGKPTVVTFHLREMLKVPDNKSVVWSDLNLLKNFLVQQKARI